MTESAPAAGRGMRNLELFILSFSTAVVVGLGTSAATIRENRYAALGFIRNSLLTLRRQTLAAAAIGALLGLIVLLVQWTRTVVLPRLRVDADPTVTAQGDGFHRAGSPGAYIVCAISSLLVLGLQARRRGSVSAPVVFFVIGAAVVWCGLHWVSRRAGERHSSYFLVLLCFLTLIGVAVVFAPHRSVFAILLRPEPLIVFLIWSALLAALRLRPNGSALRAPPGRGDRRRFPPRLVLLAAVGVLPSILAAAPEFLSRGGLRAAHPRNVVLIGIDTLRWDHVDLDPVRSGDRDRTPHLRRLAEHGTIFRTAVSQAPWTKPAFASILTGLYPRQHGAVSYTGAIPPALVMLPELLREAGYRTGAVVSHWFVDSRAGFSQGFDDFSDDNVRGHGAITSRSVTDDALRFLQDDGGRPFFLFVHYFDPHFEYRHHAEWDYAAGYRGWLSLDRLSIDNLLKNRQRLSAADLHYIEDLYDEEIAFTDQQIGRLLQALEDRGLDSQTAVVVVGDHGEEFMEHGGLSHTSTLFDESVRVPLIVALPDRPRVRREVGEVVETRALFATLLEYLSVPYAPPSGSRSLLPLMDSEAGAPAGEEGRSFAYSEVWLPDAPLDSGIRVQLSSLRSGEWKVIRDHRLGSDCLFDLRRDPGEKTDLASTEPIRLRTIRGALDVLLAGMPGHIDVPEQEMNEKMENELKSLGYL
jgi:arylsulfatase A-like enzyme